MGTHNAARENLDSTRSDHRALGAAGKGMGTQVEFSSILPVSRKAARRRALMVQISNCLQNRCWQKGFGICGYGTQLLGIDRICLTKGHKYIFASRMAELIRRVLIWKQRGKQQVTSSPVHHGQGC